MAPCVIFIDELDALGKKRSMRFNTSSEDDQTLNQLLAAMDGFDTSNNGVVVVAATNRYNLLGILCAPLCRLWGVGEPVEQAKFGMAYFWDNKSLPNYAVAF